MMACSSASPWKRVRNETSCHSAALLHGFSTVHFAPFWADDTGNLKGLVIEVPVALITPIARVG